MFIVPKPIQRRGRRNLYWEAEESIDNSICIQFDVHTSNQSRTGKQTKTTSVVNLSFGSSMSNNIMMFSCFIIIL